MTLSDEARFQTMLETWRGLQTESEAHRLEEAQRQSELWTTRMRDLEGEARALEDAGLWTSGARSTFRILGLVYDRRAHAMLLTWLLDPLSPHGRGRALLEALGAKLGLMLPNHVKILRDYGRRKTRADVAVIGRGMTLALVLLPSSLPHPRALDNLHHVLASEPDLTFVVVTPSGRLPSTFREHRDARTLSFGELIPLLEALESAGPPCHPLSDYLNCLRELCP